MEQSDEINGNLAPSGVNAPADAIRVAIGAGPDEEVSVYAPPHRSRMDGKEVVHFPITREDFERLRALPRQKLIDIGLRPWDEQGLLLFPVEWYPLIPDGFVITDIFGHVEPFRPGATDDDCCYGVLAYGLVPLASGDTTTGETPETPSRITSSTTGE